MYEAGDEAGIAPVRRDRGGVPTRGSKWSAKADPSDAPPSNKRKKLLVVAGAGVALLLAVGVVGKLTAAPDPVPVPVDPGVAAANSQEQVQKLLSQCRSYTSTDMGNEPQWDKAEASCEQEHRREVARVADDLSREQDRRASREHLRVVGRVLGAGRHRARHESSATLPVIRLFSGRVSDASSDRPGSCATSAPDAPQPWLALTAFPATVMSGDEKEFDSYLRKPIDPFELAARLHDLMAPP